MRFDKAYWGQVLLVSVALGIVAVVLFVGETDDWIFALGVWVATSAGMAGIIYDVRYRE